MVPQVRTLNRSDWKRMENQLKQEIKVGKTISVEINITYPNSSSKRPSEFEVFATVDGEELRFNFEQ